MSNWSSEFLSAKYSEAEKLLSTELKTIISRTSLDVVAQTPTYDLPTTCIGISRVTYRGVKLEAISFNEIVKFYGPSIFGTGEDEGPFSETAYQSSFDISVLGLGKAPAGRPTHFIYDTLGYKKISLFPIPFEDLASSSGNLYTGAVILSSCIVEYIQHTAGSVTLPSHIKNLYCKYYTLYKAFGAESKGQDLHASEHYKKLANYYLNKAKLFSQTLLKANEREFNPDSRTSNNFLQAPRLPGNYGVRV